MAVYALSQLSRRFRTNILALILTFFCFFLTWNHYAGGLSEPYRREHTAQLLSFNSSSDPVKQSEAPKVEIAASTRKFQPTVSSSHATHTPSPSLPTGNATLLQGAPRYIRAILNPSDQSFSRLSCPALTSGRYDYLRASAFHASAALSNAPNRPKYFFALNLHQCVDLLPRLLGSVLEAIQFLGPHNCALSIVEGRSDDGTFEVLSALSEELKRIGVKYFFTSSGVNPEQEDRISSLAELRNQALQPLIQESGLYPLESTVVFINDVSICMEDILELIHQKEYQKADMTCAMDWIFEGGSFYDVWISRSMTGDQFFEIPQSGSWDFSENLFWDDPDTRALQDAKVPYQVFSCWNGATAFTAKPLLQGLIKFRTNYIGECLMGEPTHFCKDLWHIGYGKIAVIPSVNVGYDDNQSRHVKNRHGYVSDNVRPKGTGVGSTRIEWKKKPPELIKCVPNYQHPSWVRFDEALEQHDINMTTSIDHMPNRTHNS